MMEEETKVYRRRGGFDDVSPRFFIRVWTPVGMDLWFGCEETPASSNVRIYAGKML